MSYTFSRRDFMKYTALTAVAVASAGMFTGCSGNPNQPTAVFNNADASVTFGGTSGGFLAKAIDLITSIFTPFRLS